MQTFIVLGIIPGTNLQTSFTFWIAVVVGIVGLGLVLRLWRKRFAVRAYFTARKIARFIDQYEYTGLRP